MANGKETTWLIAGLGNPGRQYERTWHNIGASFTEYVREKAGASWSNEKHFRFTKVLANDSIFPNNTILAIPNSFMNESGNGVREALKKFDIASPHLILAHDDSDLLLGDVRLEFGRGPAGHNGVRSVIFTLGTQDFWRIRFGIRKQVDAENSRTRAGDFVLKEMKTEDYGAVEEAFVAAGYETIKLMAKE
jgi:PTH1 family peptidyl-tRNA hydrolase